MTLLTHFNFGHIWASVASHVSASLTWSNALQLVTVVCGLAGNLLINRKDARGFYLWIVTNGLLVIIQVLTGMYLLMVLYVAYSALAVEGLVKWRREAKNGV